MGEHGADYDAGPEYAIEADPGRLTASFPTFSTYAEAQSAATQPCMARDGLPFPRVLSRRPGSDWEVARSAFTWICPECGEDNYCETGAALLFCGECGEEVERVIDAAISAKVEASSLGAPEAQALRATVSDDHAARIVARAKELERCTCNGVVRAHGGFSSGCPAHDPTRVTPPAEGRA